MLQILIIVVLILFSALFSGLTLGLMGLNSQELKRKKSLGDKNAGKVYEVRKNGNLLLCTLLVGNVAVNSTLSIFLGSIASGFMAGIIATVLIVIFGEITPQAVFSRYALELGARTAWLVRVLIFIFLPFCWPIAKILDKLLGDELATVYSKRELLKIVEEHGESDESDVKEEEEKIIRGALTFSEKSVSEVMIPRTQTYMVKSSVIINEELALKVARSGFSRIPVYKENIDDVIGILYADSLIDKKNINKKVEDVMDKKVYFIEEDKHLNYAFEAFLRKKHHLFIVIDKSEEVVGIISLEDVLEEIILSEIVDESQKEKEKAKDKLSRHKGKKVV